MNAKKMEEIYVNYALDAETWDMFAAMRRHDIISSDVWDRFYERCKDLVYDDDNGIIIHSETGRAAYVMDGSCSWHKVK